LDEARWSRRTSHLSFASHENPRLLSRRFALGMCLVGCRIGDSITGACDGSRWKMAQPLFEEIDMHGVNMLTRYRRRQSRITGWSSSSCWRKRPISMRREGGVATHYKRRQSMVKGGCRAAAREVGNDLELQIAA
jgi:hypothetical protein